MYGRGGGGGQVKFSNAKNILQLPPPHDVKMEVEVNDRKSDKKHEWEKFLYPFPKTERMVYYNKVVKDIP